jgi:hypothetical protein
MSSIQETMLNSMLKNLDFSKLLALPQIAEMLGLARKISADFAAIKSLQIEINSKLDKIAPAARATGRVPQLTDRGQ